MKAVCAAAFSRLRLKEMRDGVKRRKVSDFAIDLAVLDPILTVDASEEIERFRAGVRIVIHVHARSPILPATWCFVVDATNAGDLPSFAPTDLGGRLSTEIVAEIVPGARVVKAFNTLPAHVLASDPIVGAGRRVIFTSSDDDDANASVAVLCQQLRFHPIYLGRISEGGRFTAIW